MSQIVDTPPEARGAIMKSMSKFGADRIVAGAIIITIIVLITMYLNDTWTFPFP